MRPLGITDMELSSFMKKFKDKRFAAKCDRAGVFCLLDAITFPQSLSNDER